MLGSDQPVILQLLEIPPAMDALQGVVMELDDCAFPLLQGVVASDDPVIAFADVDFAMLVGARPRGPGMERKDLLTENARIFSVQGKALNESASRDVRVLVVGNPANTNALIASANAPDIDKAQFTAMTRLDHNRAISQLAGKTGAATTEISRLTIWGNHSATQYPDIHHAIIAGDRAVDRVDEEWITGEFIPTVQQRGAAIIAITVSDQMAIAAAMSNGVVNTITGSGPSGSRRSCHPKKGSASSCNSVVAPNMAVRVCVERSERLRKRKSRLIRSANNST